MDTVRVGDVELAYDIHGEGDDVVVLVCGTGQPAAMWSGLGLLPAIVASGSRVVTFDNRGIPPSSCPPPPWTTDDMAADTIGLIETVVGAPVHLAGASLGANIVHAVAMARPDLVRSAIMMVGGTQFTGSWAPIMRANMAIYDAGGEPPADLDLFTMMLAMLPPSQRDDAEAAAFVESMAGALTTTFGPGGRHGQYAANASWIAAGDDKVSELADLRCPALFVANEFDPCFAVAAAHRAAELAPDAQVVVVPGVSHVAFDPSSSELMSSAIIDFISRH